MNKFGLAVAAALMTSGGAALAADSLSCSFPNQRIDAWVRSQIIVTQDLEAGTVTVFDSLINQIQAAPIEARISADNEKRLTVKWRLKQVELRHGFAPRVDYTLTYQKATGAASINAIAPELQDYNNSDRAGGNFGARGSCKTR